MQDSTAQLNANKLECEFIPPLDLPETWGLAWDRQIDAARAWQAAGGNADSGSDQWSGQNVRPFVDRRSRALTIDFPDRRKAA